MKMITDIAFLEVAKKRLNYDPETGILTWKATFGKNGHKGERAGNLRPDGYLQIKICGVLFLAHRIAWLIQNEKWPTHYLDHINNDRGDNRISNLREASPSQNAHNSGLDRVNTSGYKGASRYKGKWRSYISINRKRQHLGYFDTAEAAHAAYCAAAERLHNKFCRIS